MSLIFKIGQEFSEWFKKGKKEKKEPQRFKERWFFPLSEIELREEEEKRKNPDYRAFKKS